MKMEQYIRIIAGSLVFISALLGFFVSRYWLILTMLVGLNLFQFGFTNWCITAKLLKKLGVKD